MISTRFDLHRKRIYIRDISVKSVGRSEDPNRIYGNTRVTSEVSEWGVSELGSWNGTCGGLDLENEFAVNRIGDYGQRRTGKTPGAKYACSECGNTSHFRGECQVCISKMGSIKKIEKVKVKKILAIIRERIMKEKGRIKAKAGI